MRATRRQPRVATTPGVGGRTVDCGDGVRLERDVPFRLSDGTVLYSDHYHAPGGVRAPTLLMRQPYGKDIATTVVHAHPVWFARHGYHVVIQDVRGRGMSEGRFEPFLNEEQDGFETVEWVAAREECNGRVGMYGFSYQGTTQLLAAVRRPKGLRCIAPWMTAGDLYHGWFYHHGLLRLAATVGWGIQMLRGDAHRLGLVKAAAGLDAAWANPGLLMQTAPYGRMAALRGRGVPGYFRDWITQDQPGRYWEARDISSRWGSVDVPALHLAGWYDLYVHGSIGLFEGLSRGAGSEESRRNQYLVAGPWVHIPWGNLVGETDLGSEAVYDTDALLLRWFNHWLKDSGEFGREPKLRCFALGENRWHEPASWPGLEPGPTQCWYLRGGGRANSSRGDGRLETTPPDGDEPRDTYVHDPDVPVTAPGGPGAPQGCYGQGRIELGNNVLVYTSAPLTERLHILGSPVVRIHFQSSCQPTDVVVKLVRVGRDGRAVNVAIGGARSTHLFGAGGFSADVVRCWRFGLEATSAVWGVGERLRLEISSSAFPLFDRNPGSGVAPRDAGPRDWRLARQQVLHTASAPSSIEFSMVS
jgi:putative CocE/NonD family hydrolase